MCSPGVECVSHKECPPALEQFQQLGQLERGSKEYEEVTQKIKKTVCNTKEKAVCCSKEEDKPSGNHNMVNNKL